MSNPTDADSSMPSPNRLWAEQLAIGGALLVGILVFMAVAHPQMLASGFEVLGPNELEVYGIASVVGILAQIIVHELGTLVSLWWHRIPIRFRIFGFGANCSAALEASPRDPWTDALVAMAGPLTGTTLAIAFSAIYDYTKAEPPMEMEPAFFLGMACVGYFYNLFTLIPILDLEGGWIAAVIPPQAWLLGLFATVLELTNIFNLVLLCVVAFGVPRLVQILRARAPRTDLGATNSQRLIMSLGYFILVIGLAWFGSTIFSAMPQVVLDSKGD
jgi:Zn-dependent protease